MKTDSTRQLIFAEVSLRVDGSIRGMKPFQISLRKLFYIFTLLTVLIGTEIAIVRGCINAQRLNEQWRVNANHEIEVSTYKANRKLLESYRNKLSPKDYEKDTKQLDEEARRLFR
jgi:hypothetical protein